MSIEAMKQALEALETEQALRNGYSYLGGVCIVSTADAAINALRTAIQQAESEPVAWMASYVDPIGNDHVYVTSHHDLAVENDMHGTPRPLYTRQALGVPDDVARDAVATVREQYRGTDWGKAAECICDAIDAAMLTAAQAQEADERDWWTDADADAARLALELECLLLDTKDTAAVSRWWASANEALDLHRARLAASQAKKEDA